MDTKKQNWRDKLREQYKDQATAWKQQYGAVKALFIEDSEDKGHVLFFRTPTRLQLSAAEAMSVAIGTGESDLYKKSERLLADCLLGGDLSLEAVLNDTAVFIAAGKFVLHDLVEQKKTDWENC